MGLKVLDANGLKLTFPQIAPSQLNAFLRCLARCCTWLVVRAMLLSRRSQRLGDLVANTIVIEKRAVSAAGVGSP